MDISEADARAVLGEALRALDWAADYRRKAEADGPDDGASGENWGWYRAGAANASEHDRRCVEERLRKTLGLSDTEDAGQPLEPLTFQPGPGSSLWFTTDGSDGTQRVIRLDRRTDNQYPCVGRDAAIVRGLLQYALDLLDDPTAPLHAVSVQEARAEAAETVERAVRAGRGVRG